MLLRGTYRNTEHRRDRWNGLEGLRSASGLRAWFNLVASCLRLK